MCVAGTPVDFICPGGTNYNEVRCRYFLFFFVSFFILLRTARVLFQDLKICDYPYRVDCKGLPSNPEPIETGTEIEQPNTTYAPEVSSSASTTASSVPLSSAETSPVTEVVSATSTTPAPAPVPVADPVAIYNYNLRKIPPSKFFLFFRNFFFPTIRITHRFLLRFSGLVNTGVRCSHKSVYRLTPDCSSVTLCRSGFTHILNCGYATSYDIVSQKCMASQRANW